MDDHGEQAQEEQPQPRELSASEEQREQDEHQHAQDYGSGSGILYVFGQQLKICRMRAGIDRRELGRLTGYSPSTIAAFEQGKRIPPPRFIDQADEVLNAGGVLKVSKEEVGRAQYPAFFRDAARLEAEAVALHMYATKAVPGLLQTKDYASATFTMWRPALSDSIIEERLAARMRRQSIFSRVPLPTITFVIEEHLLRRPLGGHVVMRGQVEQILAHAHRRNVEIQIMPTACEHHAGLEGPFTLIETRDEKRIAYVETYKHSRLYTDRTTVREIEEQYNSVRAQALSPSESMALIESLVGEA